MRCEEIAQIKFKQNNELICCAIFLSDNNLCSFTKKKFGFRANCFLFLNQGPEETVDCLTHWTKTGKIVQ